MSGSLGYGGRRYSPYPFAVCIVALLATLNDRVQKEYRATREELVEIVLNVYHPFWRIPEFYRGRVRRVAASPRWRNTPPSNKRLAAMLNVHESRAQDYRATSGAWGTTRKDYLEPEEAEFRKNATRPPEFAEYVDAARAEGYDPPLMPYDCWVRYAEVREIRKSGRHWLDGRESFRKANSEETSAFPALLERSVPCKFYRDYFPGL